MRKFLIDYYIFDDDEKITYLDCLITLNENGQFTTFERIANEIQTCDILILIKDFSEILSNTVIKMLMNIILKRCNENEIC